MSFIDFEGYSLYYSYLKEDNNPDQPVLIFLHDSWGCTEMWEDFPRKTAKLFGLNALVYDRRGYGNSSRFSTKERTKFYLHEEADELIRVMDALKINQAVLYGHSDGASISLIAAATYTERFKAIMVEGAHSFVEEKGKAAVKDSRDKAKHNSLLKSLEKYHGDKTEELFRRWHAAWLGDFFADWTIIPMLKNIQAPLLAFRGEHDPYDTEEQLLVLEREVHAPITTMIIPDAAHTPRKENEEATDKLIRDFLHSISQQH